ncbi:dihydrofolate reductase family protein [Kitasatospora sp. NBC_01539]|uniref:dihydrofolate reductase family protein n=1 Tax=Kitasatospora sp. NBC_01539 TaxID=2903577 RepID=UPI0038601C61
MRKVVLMMSISLDGFIEAADRSLDWHRVDDELHHHFNDYLATAGAFLEGRVVYELMTAYWPTADADPASPATVREFARIWRETPKIVFSTTLQHVDRNAELRREVDPEEIRELKTRPGGDLVVGGANLGATFRRHDLIDEYRVYVHPVLIGRGTPLFTPTDHHTALEPVENRTFGNGVVLLRYARVRPEAAR